MWEEDSSTPVLHSWWVRYFTNTLSRFTPEVRHSFKSDDDVSADSSQLNDVRKSRSSSEHLSPKSSLRSDNEASPTKTHAPVSKLKLCSQKMIDLKDILTSDKKLNAQTVGLFLTAQSQVHFVKRRSATSDYSVDYNPYKRTRRSRDVDS